MLSLADRKATDLAVSQSQQNQVSGLSKGQEQGSRPTSTPATLPKSTPLPKPDTPGASPAPSPALEKSQKPETAPGQTKEKKQPSTPSTPVTPPGEISPSPTPPVHLPVNLNSLIPGNFGALTQTAVKNLQKNFGLPESGIADEATGLKITELNRALARKKPPKISSVAPAEIAAGTIVTLTGSGFTLENNSLFVRGQTVLTKLTSHDGTAMVFSVPENTPCIVGQSCPIKIVNANGISNARPFKLRDIVAPPNPEPEPLPQPPPPSPTPTPAPSVKDIVPPVRSNGGPTGVIHTTYDTLFVNTDENATCKYSTIAGTSYAAMPNTFYNDTWITYNNGLNTFHYSGVSEETGQYIISGLTYGSSYTYYVRCKDSAGNVNTDDYVIAFSVQSATPALTAISPSIVTTGMAVTLYGSGFTPTENTVTFTGSFTEPNQIITGVSSPDGVTLDVTIPATMPCRPAVVSQCGMFVSNKNGKSGSLIFWLGQHIDPVTVLSPNGGERVVPGVGVTISASGGKSEAFGGAVSIGYYLVQSSATTQSDPTDLIIGRIPGGTGYVWDARKVCEGLVCWDVAPGDYKILAVGTDTLNLNTIWDSTANIAGNIDVSDAPFTILPSPSISVVSPNGGEAYKYGNTVTIAWEANTIMSKLVNIRLLKAGSPVLTIATNVAQSTDSGIFIQSWIVPSTLAVGSDYAIEISDTANSAVKDTSDGQFRIASLAALQIYGPNGGETAMRGFSALLFWNYSGYTPASINVNLYKGGVFYRTLATYVKPVGFSGYSFLKEPYPYNSRYAEIPLGLDLPEGNDYTLEIVDGADGSINDRSDAPFRIVTIPGLTTFQGRMVDALTGEPIPNATFAGYTSQYPYALPRFTSNVNGEFSYATNTTDLVSLRQNKGLFYGGNGACNNITGGGIIRYADLPRTWLNGGWFPWLAPYSLNNYPLITPNVEFGNIPLWPTAQRIYTFTDLPAQLGIYYQKADGTISGGGGNSNYKLGHVLSYPFPLGFNTRIQFTDKAGTKYVSPFALFSTNIRCPIATLSFMDGTFQWEPYPIGITYSYNGGYVGQSFMATLKAAPYAPYSGTGPFTWKLLSTSLPPGLTFDAAAGIISGVPTTAGTYTVSVRVTDVNGVRASQDLTFIVK